MNERNSLTIAGSILLAVVWALPALARANAAENLPPKEETARLKAMASKVFGIRWIGPVHAGQERGVVAVTDGTTTLTERGRRTYIVHNKRATAAGDTRTYSGTDDALKKRGTRILEAIGVKPSEILAAKVLQQMKQDAYREPGGKTRLEPPRKGRRTLLITRQVEGIAVPSSRLLLNLDANGRIAFLELTWPEITKETVEQARTLENVSKREFKPPAVEAATVESVEPVVLHSPAVGFFDDQVAALRVIYRPDRPDLGKKPVRYVDAEGRDVTLPRQMERPREEPVQRKSPSSER